MRHEAEVAEREDQTDAEAEGSAVDLLAEVEPPGEPLGVSLTELLVRQTLSDLENRLTADHHLKEVHPAGDPIQDEAEGAEDDRRVS